MWISISTRRPRLAAAAALAAALAVVLAGCGTPADSAGGGAPVPTQKTDAALHDRLPADVKQAGVVRIGTEALYPPFESFAADNKTIVGLDPDLATALGQILGVRVTVTHTAFAGLLTALDAGRFDVVMAAIIDTKAREQKYDFVDYFTTGQGIVVQKGNPKNIRGVADLCGRNVAVLTASVQEKLLGGFNQKECAGKAITVAALPSDKDALLQVQTGRADASFTEDAVGTYNARTIGGGNQFEVANTRALLPVPVGIVFDKKQAALRDAFQAALRELVANGTYARILQQHDMSSGVLTGATVNGGTA